jgi:hypothetical protein
VPLKCGLTAAAAATTLRRCPKAVTIDQRLSRGLDRGSDDRNPDFGTHRDGRRAPAYLLSETDLIGYLKRVLGRPLIAHVTGTADANNVSRWASGRARPDRVVWERLRTLATLHIALTAIVGSESSGAQWFTGANPSLGFKMPADELRAGNVAPVFAAARDLAQR